MTMLKFLPYIFITMPILPIASKGQIMTATNTNSWPSFYNSSTVEAGITTSNYITLQFHASTERYENWKLTAQVAGNITNGTSTVNPDYFFLRYNNQENNNEVTGLINPVQGTIGLGNNETILVQKSTSPLESTNYYFELHYDFIIKGQEYTTALTNGAYAIPIVFRLYSSQGELIGQTAYNYYFQIWVFDAPQKSNITIQSTVNRVNLNFNTSENYLNGISVLIPNALEITNSNSSAYITVRAESDFINSASASLPISVISIEPSAGSQSGSFSYHTVPLSSKAQTLIDNISAVNNQAYINLRYFTLPHDPYLYNAPAGNYNSTIYFSIDPK